MPYERVVVLVALVLTNQDVSSRRTGYSSVDFSSWVSTTIYTPFLSSPLTPFNWYWRFSRFIHRFHVRSRIYPALTFITIVHYLFCLPPSPFIALLWACTWKWKYFSWHFIFRKTIRKAERGNITNLVIKVRFRRGESAARRAFFQLGANNCLTHELSHSRQ